MRKEKRRLGRVKLVQNITLFVLFIFLLYFLINTFIISIMKVEGNSMSPTFKDGQKLVFSKINIRSESLKRGEVVIFRDKDEKKYIKRVIGLPGELVEIKKGKVFVNGRQIEEESFGLTYKYNLDYWYLKSDEFFVLGDNRSQNDSKDSRIFGPVNINRIDGKFMFEL